MRDCVDDRTKDRWQSSLEVVLFRDTGKAADMPKFDDRWSLGIWLGERAWHQMNTALALR